MKNSFRAHLVFLGVIVALWGAQSCQHDSSPTSSATSPASDTKPALTPTTGALSIEGTLVGAVSRRALPNVQVKLGAHTAITDAQGKFTFANAKDTPLSFQVSGETVYTRVAAIENNASIELDAIEKDSGFHLGFYRELARGNHPTEQHLYPLQRWTSPPTFYIDTNPAATNDPEISRETIESVRQLITKMTPIFTGEVFEAADIQLHYFGGYDFSLIPDNTIVISFDDSLMDRGAMGVTFTEPSFQAAPTGALSKAWIFVLNADAPYQNTGISKIELLAHEMGHAFGFRHTSLLPSVMMKIGVFGGTYSSHDRLHMSLVYHRPFGNTDIDADPLPNQKSFGELPGRQAFIDRAPVSLSPKMKSDPSRLSSPTAYLFSTVPGHNISE